MFNLKENILTIVLAAIIVAIASAVAGNIGRHAPVVKLVSGLFITLVVFAAFADIPLFDYSKYWSQINSDSDTVVAEGKNIANAEYARIIKAQTEAYILNKAGYLDVDLKVEVILSDNESQIPVGVVLTGEVSPYAKSRIQRMITDDLGIKQEDQKWM